MQIDKNSGKKWYFGVFLLFLLISSKQNKKSDLEQIFKELHYFC